MINFVNGYNKPVFLIYHAGNTPERIDMSMYYQGLKEYFEESQISHSSIGGTKKYLSLYCNKYFELDYSGLLKEPDAIKLQKIWRASWAGKRIILIPHSDNLAYSYNVRVRPSQKTLGLHYGGLLSFGNKDLVITFDVTDALQDLGWTSADDLLINISNLKIL